MIPIHLYMYFTFNIILDTGRLPESWLEGIIRSILLKLFCSFIDFSKAFDSVWMVALWMKLLSKQINGKRFRIIFNMYDSIKSCVSFNGDQSPFFHSHKGMRQGENLSPVFVCYLSE